MKKSSMAAAAASRLSPRKDTTRALDDSDVVKTDGIYSHKIKQQISTSAKMSGGDVSTAAHLTPSKSFVSFNQHRGFVLLLAAIHGPGRISFVLCFDYRSVWETQGECISPVPCLAMALPG